MDKTEIIFEYLGGLYSRRLSEILNDNPEKSVDDLKEEINNDSVVKFINRETLKLN